MAKHKQHANLLALCFLAPSLIGFLLFFIIPFGVGFYYSLVDQPVKGNFVGFLNYINLLKNSSFLTAAQNTALFTLLGVPLNIALSLGLALLLNQQVYLRSLFRTLFITPLVVPVGSVVLVWLAIFDLNGSLNGFLSAWGFQPVDWMKTDWARLVVLLLYLWKNVGYCMILFIAGLQDIPVEYYEAARIDGAKPWQEFWHITRVYLTPTTFFALIISIINSFKVFRETYLISGDHPQTSIYMLQHYMNNMFLSLDYQKLTAAAFIMALIIVILVVVFFKVERKINQGLAS